VAVGEHVDVGVGHAALIEGPDRFRQPTVGEAAFAHQGPQALAEWLVTLLAHLKSSGKILTATAVIG
jgi:hypothetical protein